MLDRESFVFGEKMPLYEYICPDCGYEFDALQSFHDDPIRKCPTCDQENVRKKISKPSFSLKGDGWYKDHYGLKESSSSSSSSKETSSSPKDASSGTDKKPSADGDS